VFLNLFIDNPPYNFLDILKKVQFYLPIE
jgi:hypothetical protein